MVTIVSIDAVDYYPSVRFKLVRKAIQYYCRTLPAEDRVKIQDCLELIKFGMASTLFSFQGQYYEYDGDQDPDERGLTIGGFESAWLADLVGAFILEKTQVHFEESVYAGIYRDDGLAVFLGKWTAEDVSEWREEFQDTVNEIAEGGYLQYTCDLWDPTGENIAMTGDCQVSTTSKSTFPFLDMELYWNQDQDLRFRVHLKPNQQLMYLNRGSTHTRCCYKAIQKGVFGRLGKLTSVDGDNASKRLSDLYPDHFTALERAKVIRGTVPTLKQQHQEDTPQAYNARKLKQLQRDKDRTIYFCVGHSDAWAKPIHHVIKELKQQFGIKWLRVSMSYHRFPNLRELFQKDLNKKMNVGICSKDFQALECNCRGGQCGYNNVCRTPIVVYKVECKMTNKVYIGSTQQHFKTRMQHHYAETRALQKTGKRSDSFARHFAGLYRRMDIRPTLLRNETTCSVLWKGNPISAVKTFGTNNCLLCNKERLEILKMNRYKPDLLINSCHEIYGACRHKPRFHRYHKAQD